MLVELVFVQDHVLVVFVDDFGVLVRVLLRLHFLKIEFVGDLSVKELAGKVLAEEHENHDESSLEASNVS